MLTATAIEPASQIDPSPPRRNAWRIAAVSLVILLVVAFFTEMLRNVPQELATPATSTITDL